MVIRILTILLSALLLFSCSESTEEFAAENTNPTLKNDVTSETLQQSITGLINQRQYQEAIDYLDSIDTQSIAETNYVAGQIQYWGVMEDGLSLSGLYKLNVSVDQLIKFSDSCWVFPGTSDAQDSGAAQAWQTAATNAAARYKTALYQLSNSKSE